MNSDNTISLNLQPKRPAIYPAVLLAVLLTIPMLTLWSPAARAETATGSGTPDGTAANQAPAEAAVAAPEYLLLNLETALKLALENNTDLKRSGLDVASARLGLDSKERTFHPSLSLSGSVSSRWSDPATPGGDSMTQSAGLRIGSGYTLFNGFADSASRDAARQEVLGAEHTGARTAETLAYQVVSRFLAAAAATEQIRVQQQNVTAQQELLRKIEAFYQAGKRPVVDLYQQQAETSGAEYQLISVQRDCELKKLALLNEMGLDPAIDLELEALDPDNLKTRLVPPADVDRAVAVAREQRADYKAALAALDAAELDVRAAKGGYWPELSLSAEAGTSWSDSATASWSDQFLEDNPYASAGLSIALPLYDRNQVRNAVAAGELSRGRSRLAKLDLERQIVSDIRTAYLEYETAARQVDSATARINYTRQALENFEQRYNLNAATLLEVIQARANHLSASYEKIAADYNLIDKLVAIFYATGDLSVLTGIADGEPAGARN